MNLVADRESTMKIKKNSVKSNIYKEAFEKFDKDKSNTIDAKELQALFNSLGWKDEDLVNSALEFLDKDFNSSIDFEEFFSFAEFAWKFVAVNGDLLLESTVHGEVVTRKKSINATKKNSLIQAPRLSSLLGGPALTEISCDESHETEGGEDTPKRPATRAGDDLFGNQKRASLLSPIEAQKDLRPKTVGAEMSQTKQVAPRPLKRPLPNSLEAKKRAAAARKLAFEKKNGKAESRKEFLTKTKNQKRLLANAYSPSNQLKSLLSSPRARNKDS
jgi:hypothetical protein